VRGLLYNTLRVYGSILPNFGGGGGVLGDLGPPVKLIGLW
jgi:hypothetical protein